MAEPIRYEVDLDARVHHLVVVEVTVPDDLDAPARLVFPTWTPGSYVIRDYVHHVQRISARDGAGRPVTLRPDGVTAWWLPDDCEGPVTVELELYANDLTVRTNHVDDRHALLVGPATFPYVRGAEDRPHLVRLAAPPGQQVFSLLPSAGEPDTFLAEDREHLMDAAFEVGDHTVAEFDVSGTPHRLVWVGRWGGPDPDGLAADAAAVCEQAVELFGGDLPTAGYTVLCVGIGRGWGGLEHRDGTVLTVPPTTLHARDGTRRLQSLLAHEYVHLWNVKRLTPRALVDLDYVEPAPTTALWVVEGWTSYYDLLLPLRAGVWPWDHFAGELAARMRAVREAPATELQSVREASWQAWVKHYVRDENTPNSTVNYYAHGALLAWCLDLLIRHDSPASDGLDTALRLLWERHGHAGRGYTEDDVQAACEDAAGRGLADFFDDYVSAPAPPPVDELLGVAGLRRVGGGDTASEAPWLGVQTDQRDGRVVLSSVLRDGPAWQAGLTGGDELLAIDGLRVGPDSLSDVLSMHEPGESVPVTVFRDARLVEAEVAPGAPPPQLRLAPVEDPDPAQRAAFRSWTGGLELDQLDRGAPAELPSR